MKSVDPMRMTEMKLKNNNVVQNTNENNSREHIFT